MNNIHKLPYTADEIEELLKSAGSAVTHSAQVLGDGQKAQARKNIGAADAASVGDIETALDSIIAIQNELIGGSSV